MLQFYKILLILREQNISKLVDLLHQKEMSSSEYIINTYSYILNYYTTDVLLFCSLSVSSSVQCCMTYVFRNKLWKRKKMPISKSTLWKLWNFSLTRKKKSWKQHTVWLQNAIVIYLVLNAQISRNFSKKKMVREGISAFSTLWYIEKKHYLFFLEVVPIKRKCLLHSQENGCFLCIWLLSINLKGLLLFWSKWCK